MKFGGLLYTLKEGTDYYWGYANNRNVGNATATIYASTGGNFLGSFSIPFYIDRISIGSENVYYGQTSFNVDGTTYNTVSRVTTADGRADQSFPQSDQQRGYHNSAGRRGRLYRFRTKRS